MEDFVTFEIAKKLKEKGFSLNKEDIEFIGCRLIFSDKCTIKRISTIGAYNKEYFGENIDCPTISQVLKWLRNEKKIWICVNPVKSGFETTIYDSVKQYYNGEYGGWMYYNNLVTTLHFGLNYENSVIDGIKYVLDNLI